ncbi:MAG: hypothetical protein U5L06_02645 [Rhodovibrio sp.]|nr:hypothetical protein [Rhodovibrio sp.]
MPTPSAQDDRRRDRIGEATGTGEAAAVALAGSVVGLIGVMLILVQSAWDLYVRWSHEKLRRRVEDAGPHGISPDLNLAQLNREALGAYERRMRRYRWWQTVFFVLGAGLLLCSYAVQIALQIR